MDSRMLAVAAVVTAASLACGFARDSGRQAKEEYVTFSGVSRQGDLNDALGDAVRKAEASAAERGADILIEWELVKVRGRRGGFAGFNEIQVTIRVPKASLPGGEDR